MAKGKAYSRQRTVDGIVQKQCPVCEQWMPLTDWPRWSSGVMKDSCSPACTRIKQRRYYRADPSRQRAAMQRYNASHRPQSAALSDATARHDGEYVVLTVCTTEGEMQVRIKPSQANALAYDLRTASYRASETRWALMREGNGYDDD